MSNKIWVADVITEASDHYYFAFQKKPRRENLIKMVWELEGKGEDLDFYLNTTSVRLQEVELQ